MLLYSSRAWQLTLLALTALYAALIALQVARFLWFDELLTYFIARTPDLGHLLASVKRWDLNPPLLHVLAHASLWSTNGRVLAVRIPSVLEFYFASLLLYWYSYRKLGCAFAALPVLVLWYSPLFRYATEARPYALLCFFFCALLSLWDVAVTSFQRRLALAGVALSSVGLLSSHLVATLSLLAFAAAEIARAWERKKPDYPLWSALFLPLAVLVFYAPFLKNYEAIGYYPVAFQASFGKAVSFYWHTLSGAAFCLVVAAFTGSIVSGTKELRTPDLRLRSFEYVFFAAMAVVPLLLNIELMLNHAPFWGRYAITSGVALYLLGGLLVAAPFRDNSRVSYFSVSIVFLLVFAVRVIIPWGARFSHPAPANIAALIQIKPGLPMVAASGLTFIEMGQHEDTRVSNRLFYLQDRSAAIEFAHATLFEDLGDFNRAFALPGTVESYDKFTQEHHDFLVFGTLDYPEDWLLRKLVADGATLTPLGDFETPYKDKTLYQVRLGGRRFEPAPSRSSRNATSLLPNEFRRVRPYIQEKVKR